MREPTTQFRVLVEAGPDGDHEDRELLSQQLVRALLESDAESVEPVPGPPPPTGSKAGDLTTAGFAVTVMSAGLPPLLTMLHSWATSRQRRAVVRVEGPGGAVIEIPNVPLEQLREVMAQWSRPSSDG